MLCLIPKKGKDLTKLESWRPLSVLNTDYKILAKVSAKRLKLGLREIINPDQIGYMESRFYGENIRLIADMIDFCKFEKAFDKINWNFLHACLKRFGFGEIFKQEGQGCPKRRVAQAAIRLATAVIKFRKKERNVRSPS